MNPKTAFILAACLMLWAVVIYKCIERARENNLSGRGADHGRIRTDVETTAPPRDVSAITLEIPAKTVAAAQSFNPDAQRVINELVAEGFTPEEAAEAYRMVNESANERRTNRMAMPGVRSNVELRRFPLFDEVENPK